MTPFHFITICTKFHCSAFLMEESLQNQKKSSSVITKKNVVYGNRTRKLCQVNLMTLWLNSESRYKFSGKIFIKKNKWLDITRIIHFQTKISQVLCKIKYIPGFFKLPFRMQSFLITRFFFSFNSATNITFTG